MPTDPRQALFESLEEAVTQAVFPGCVALVWADGATLYHEAHGVLASHPRAPLRGHRVERSTVYDLASLTKVLATTTLAAIAVGEGRVAVDDPIPAPWSRACPGATLRDLLQHSAGLEAHREFFAAHPGGDPVGPAPILDAVVATPPAARPGERTIYSDLGFMILGAWIERLFDCDLGRLFEDRIAWPLGLVRKPLPRLGYHRLGTVRGPTAAEEPWVAPTEVYDPTLHPAALPSYFGIRASRRPREIRTAHYEVHDDNAFAMGGLAGHAGLFGDAEAVLEIARGWLDSDLPGLDPAVRERFWAPPTLAGSTRRLGWDGVAGDGGATGGALSAAAIGHLGYTGCSLWIDPRPSSRRIVILLSNRVHPTRESPAIVSLRPAFHHLAARL